MQIPSEAPEILKRTVPQSIGLQGVKSKCKIFRYRKDSTLVLRGTSCTFEGGHKVGIVGRTASGKSTLISELFRLVEPAGGRIVVDGVDIFKIGPHDLRSFGVIPQDPTLFNGTFFSDYLLSFYLHWKKVFGKCQLREAVKEKENGLDSLVVEDESNWSMGQWQLFCLEHALLRKSKILVLDEATASIDNATDMILQKTIRTEFANCTRNVNIIPMTCFGCCNTGKLVEYDEFMKLMKNKDSLFGQLVKEYWSHYHSAKSH
ncbi:hypothetical protein FXO38_24069 [Capsicum annuum]|uniref:ABC-type xenobiotic transporter n=1 Tax=Capsicum annuum TaxID=4072 RepID=A0A2G2Z9G4_CAPAN|nr:hypothetical protein FXO37_32767 [Capsicum annuum]KAF3636633.1 hypothetical protein FXO38_24069 [Capsicum annuum]PHT78515.1 hypothetical protein T459_16567 [Capsicum annuum]